MDIGEHTRNADENSSNTQVPHNNNMLAPQQTQQQPRQPAILLQVSSSHGSEFLRSSSLNAFLRDASSYRHAQENEPWRGSSGFGLANLLNRSIPNNPNNTVATGPKFSLPSLHALSKPLVSVKPEFAAGPQHSMLKPQPRSPLPVAMESVHESQPRPLAIHTSDPSEHKPAATSPSSSKETTPRKNNNNNSARRIAPAPTDEDDGDQDDEASGGSIRGGRWTADEHERFLAGFRIHGHKWKRVQQVVRTRSVTQVRTHAQKYLLKVAKLQAEKKEGKPIDVSALNDRYLSGRGGVGADSSSDAEQGGGANTAPSSPDNNAGSKTRFYDDGLDGDRIPKPLRKKARHNNNNIVVAGQHVDILDQEYICAAATTLCFLMTQKIDSLFESNRSNGDLDKDLEPYDCYSAQPTTVTNVAVVTVAGDEQAFAADKSRKRAFMHFLTESPVSYRYSTCWQACSHGARANCLLFIYFLQVQYPADAAHYAYEESEQRAETPSYAIEGKKLYS